MNNVDSTENLVNKREELETLKKVIEHYLVFVVEENFDQISKYSFSYQIIVKALKKMNKIEHNLQVSFLQVKKSKLKMASIKTHLLETSAKFLLYKQKLKNMLQVHEIIKNKLCNWISVFLNSKKLKSSGKYCTLYKNMLHIKDELEEEKKINNRKSLIVKDILLQKSKNKIEKLKIYLEKELKNIFLERKDNYSELINFLFIEEDLNKNNDDKLDNVNLTFLTFLNRYFCQYINKR